MTENMEVAEQEQDDSVLMTPDELALLKKLQEKRKAMSKAMSGEKEKLFESLTKNFAGIISKAKKDIVTVSTKDGYEDGQDYSITFGVDEDKEEIDGDKVARQILDDNLSVIESLIGISNSLKVQGTYEGQKLFWQVRKRK